MLRLNIKSKLADNRRHKSVAKLFVKTERYHDEQYRQEHIRRMETD